MAPRPQNRVSIVRSQDGIAQVALQAIGHRMRISVRREVYRLPLTPVTVNDKSFNVRTAGSAFVVEEPETNRRTRVETNHDLPEDLATFAGSSEVLGTLIVGAVYVAHVLTDQPDGLVGQAIEITCGGNTHRVSST